MEKICLATGEENPAEWDTIDAETQEHLVLWYNVCQKDLDQNDLELLADLHHKNEITFIACRECMDVCFDAHPRNWGDFQGTGVGMTEGYMGDYCHTCYNEVKDQAERMGII